MEFNFTELIIGKFTKIIFLTSLVPKMFVVQCTNNLVPIHAFHSPSEGAFDGVKLMIPTLFEHLVKI